MDDLEEYDSYYTFEVYKEKRRALIKALAEELTDLELEQYDSPMDGDETEFFGKMLTQYLDDLNGNK